MKTTLALLAALTLAAPAIAMPDTYDDCITAKLDAHYAATRKVYPNGALDRLVQACAPQLVAMCLTYTGSLRSGCFGISTLNAASAVDRYSPPGARR